MKLPDKDFEVFQAEALRWIEAFGLKDWEVGFSFDDQNPDCRATCSCSDLGSRICCLGLTRTWPSRPTTADLQRCAFHEVLELLLMPMRLKLQDILEVSTPLLDKETHRIIRILENVVWAPPPVKRTEKPKVRRSKK